MARIGRHQLVHPKFTRCSRDLHQILWICRCQQRLDSRTLGQVFVIFHRGVDRRAAKVTVSSLSPIFLSTCRSAGCRLCAQHWSRRTHGRRKSLHKIRWTSDPRRESTSSIMTVTAFHCFLFIIQHVSAHHVAKGRGCFEVLGLIFLHPWRQYQYRGIFPEPYPVK